MRRFEKIDIGYELTASITSGIAPVPVVHVNALGTEQDQWDQVVPRLYLHTTVTYDRPGIGESDPLPPYLVDQPRTFGALADELRSLLDKLAIDSPHVVVGHSVGALIAMMYAARYGTHTAGLVLVDCTTLDYLTGTGWPKYEGGNDNPGSSMLDIPGSIIELDTAIWPSVPAAVLTSAPGRWTRLTAADAAEYAPLTLEQLDQKWQDGQRLLAEKLDALFVVADWAGHHVAADQPELVAACVSAVITAARGDSPVTIPPAQLRYAGGSCSVPRLDRRSSEPAQEQ
ncbi:alpha/beta fold hydrolase [Nocardia sp. SYP-A9097]|uniref:alpha/beta fold hydrolase n=1 Tax=Nocardia sp. SYP-A9097 TaxID=2663237 RepID=UPI00129A7A4A|nr:alpha/beta hydrolase [Nocardia sp. SYP-A9097]MRH93523.1 alpha/beta fold hydrolase [Nocardia sp. SYP-A9097]